MVWGLNWLFGKKKSSAVEQNQLATPNAVVEPLPTAVAIPVVEKEKESACPMKGKGSSMGFSTSLCPMKGKKSSEESSSTTSTSIINNDNSNSNSNSNNISQSQNQQEQQQPQQSSVSKCPVKGKSGQIYNVYSQPIDPTNNMPSNANQQKSMGQTSDLPTERVVSNIPKGGTESDTWVYPSPQMFWNAIVRKGKQGDTKEEDIEAVVAIHNNMNENTWNAVAEWEKLHGNDSPKLSRFLGRPFDLSPKAQLKGFLGHMLPFDRHDWVVLSNNGVEKRYVIDYYHDEEISKGDKLPSQLQDYKSIKSITVDVRPAIDSIDAILDRVFFMPYARFMHTTTYYPPKFLPKDFPSSIFNTRAYIERDLPPNPNADDKNQKKIEDPKLTTLNIQDTTEMIKQSCQDTLKAVVECDNEESCQKASAMLTLCMGRIVCKNETKEFDKIIASGNADDSTIENAFLKVESCMDEFQLFVKESQKAAASQETAK